MIIIIIIIVIIIMSITLLSLLFPLHVVVGRHRRVHLLGALDLAVRGAYV